MVQSRGFFVSIFVAAAVVGAVTLIHFNESNRDSVGENTLGREEPVLISVAASELHKKIKEKGSRVTIVNLWATFCEPCRQEFPILMRAFREYRDQGVDLILVSLDFKSETQEVQDFLTEQRVDFETYMKDPNDRAFISEIDPEWPGTIPTTLIFDAKGDLKFSVPKALTFEELEEKIISVLGSKN